MKKKVIFMQMTQQADKRDVRSMQRLIYMQSKILS